MSLMGTFLVLGTFLVPAQVNACGTDISGGISSKARLGTLITPTLDMTFSPAKMRKKRSASDAQASSAAAALTNVQRQLKLAVSAALRENNVLVGADPAIDVDYTPREAKIASGNTCTEPGTFIVYRGTVIYECKTESGSQTTVTGTTGTPGTGTTDEPSTGTSNTPVSGGTASTTTAGTSELTSPPSELTTVADPVGPDVQVVEKSLKNWDRRLQSESLHRRRVVRAAGVEADPFIQPIQIVVDAHQAIYEGQWESIARSVEKFLEQKGVLFDDDIKVTLL